MTEHILIADDDEVSCQLFAEALDAEGFHVDQVTSGDRLIFSGGASQPLRAEIRMRTLSPMVPAVVMMPTVMQHAAGGGRGAQG